MQNSSYRFQDYLKYNLKIIYWKSDHYWLGKLIEHIQIMTQGETFEELEKDLKDAYLLMTMNDKDLLDLEHVNGIEILLPTNVLNYLLLKYHAINY